MQHFRGDRGFLVEGEGAGVGFAFAFAEAAAGEEGRVGGGVIDDLVDGEEVEGYLLGVWAKSAFGVAKEILFCGGFSG